MKNSRILLLGSSGQLGITLLSDLKKDFDVHSLSRPQLNLSKKDELIKIIEQSEPEILINACAFTDVDEAEKQPEKAFKVNSELPFLLAEISKNTGCLLVHYSTDFVFNGEKKEPYTEEDLCEPINSYGNSKRQGELSILESGCRNLILRTSWIFSPYRKNFLLTILELASRQDQLRIVNDQIGCPTSTYLISDVTRELLSKFLRDKDFELGLYHLASKGKTSWFEFTQEIIKLAKKINLRIKLSENDIIPILSEQYPLPAKRPRNSVLDTSKISNILDESLLTWQSCLERVVKEVSNKRKYE
jgi:dTDP-4-dehydrorhamnose reductase